MSRSIPTIPYATSVALVLSSGPDDPSAHALLARAASLAGGQVRVIMTARGIAWAHDQGALNAWHERGWSVSVCSRHAGSQGWTIEKCPRGVQWTSVPTWIGEHDAGCDAVWVAIP